MIRNYLKIAFRSLMKNRLFSIINISGLTIGMVSFVLIMLYVNYESSYDRFFTNAEQVQRVYMDYMEGEAYEAGDAQSYLPSGPLLKDNFPEILDYARLYQLDNTIIVYGNNTLEVAHGLIADSTYFKVFGHEILQSKHINPLSEPNTIVLTEHVSHKLFGNENPVGIPILLYDSGNKVELVVSGVMKDIPKNTHIQTDYLISFASNETGGFFSEDNAWNNNSFFTYLLVNSATDMGALKAKIMAFDDGVENERHNIEALTDIHLKSDKPYEAAKNGSAARVKFLLAMALVIIILSWLNFINLSVSKAMERALETGVRKASGASKLQLVHQFLLESGIINVIAIVLAFGLTFLVLPLFSSFTGKDLSVGILSNSFYIYIALVVLMGAFVSGLLPAILLAETNPSLILKGKNRRKQNHVYAQKTLVSLQIVATIVLLVLTIAINKQLSFLQDRGMGFDNNLVLSISGEDFSDIGEDAYRNKYLLLKETLKTISGVECVASSQSFPGDGYMSMSCSVGFGGTDGERYERGLFYNYRFDEHYIPLMDYTLLAGRNFEEHDKGKGVIILNEAFAQFLGYTDPQSIIGKSLKHGGGDLLIIGVLKNHYFFGFKAKEPNMLYSYDDYADGGLLVKLNVQGNNGLSQLISKIEKEWYGTFSKSTFSYQFIDEQFNQYFEEERLFNKTFSAFTLLAIFIASLGLFGLGTQICSQRTKEVGVRKVNGAKVFEVIAMLNKEFVQWVIIAFALAAPLGYYLVYKWLQNFAYKTEISWWIFALAGFITMGIALVTVSWQTFKVARRNPVEALRYE